MCANWVIFRFLIAGGIIPRNWTVGYAGLINGLKSKCCRLQSHAMNICPSFGTVDMKNLVGNQCSFSRDTSFFEVPQHINYFHSVMRRKGKPVKWFDPWTGAWGTSNSQLCLGFPALPRQINCVSVSHLHQWGGNSSAFRSHRPYAHCRMEQTAGFPG